MLKTYETFVLPDNVEELFEETPDYIIDAIDTVTAKLAIAELAQRREIPLISSMGTGNKLHPELFESQTCQRPVCVRSASDAAGTENKRDSTSESIVFTGKTSRYVRT